MIEVAPEHKKLLSGTGIAFLVVLSLYFAVKFLGEARSFMHGGSEGANTITMSGYGEVSAVPDIASIYFTIEKEALTAKEAQEQVALIEKKALDFLRTSKIEDKDIKAENISVSPKYEYKYDKTSLAPCSEFYCPPRPGKNVITGYIASESITVKIRDIDNVGEITQGLTEVEVSNLNGPNFEIDDEDALKAQARKAAIEDARGKAKALARDLGVRLGRVVTFSENDYAYPLYATRGVAMAEDASQKVAPAELPKGENLITSNVTITYEIR